MHLAVDDLLGALRRGGLRVTNARRAICAVLAESHQEHLTAADIHTRATTRAGEEIDQSTVYRTLDVLQGLGILHHVHLGHGPGLVHLSDRLDHHHLFCERCGNSFDIPVERLAPIFTDLAGEFGFVPDSLHFALVGTCGDCAQLDPERA